MQLSRMLARMGWTLSRRGAWSTLRRLALVFSAFALALAFGALALYDASLDGRTERAQQIQPIESGNPRLLVSPVSFAQVLDRPVTVISIWPLVPDAPLPPGVTKWPQPGEAVASAALIRDLKTAGQGQIYGRVTGTISSEGLETGTERRVYLVPRKASLAPSTMIRASGFGEKNNWSTGPGVGYLYGVDPLQARLLVIGALIVPACLALYVAAGLDGDSRRRRVQLLDTLGAGRVHRAILDSAESVAPIAVGSVLGGTVVMSAMIRDVPLPFVDAQLLAVDARQSWLSLLFICLATPIVGMVLILASRGNWRPVKGRSPFSLAQSAPKAGWFALLGFGLAFWLPRQMANGSLQMLAYLIGVLLVAVTVPALLGLVSSSIAHWLSKRRSAPLLIGGKQLQFSARRTARLTAGVCFAILIVGQAQLWQGLFGQQRQMAIETRDAVGNSVLVANQTRYDRPGLDNFLAGLPSDVGTVWVTNIAPADPQDDFVTLISGPCSSLSALRMPCSTEPQTLKSQLGLSTQAQYLMLWSVVSSSPPSIQVKEAPDLNSLSQSDSRLVLVSLSGGSLPVARILSESYEDVSGGLGLEALGQGYLTSATVLSLRGTWIIFLGGLGVFIISVSFAAALAGDALAQARAIASLVSFSEKRGWVFLFCAVRSAGPIVLAGALGALSYYVLAFGLSSETRPVTPSELFVGSSMTVSVLAGLLASAGAAATVAKYARTWTPGMDV